MRATRSALRLISFEALRLSAEGNGCGYALMLYSCSTIQPQIFELPNFSKTSSGNNLFGAYFKAWSSALCDNHYEYNHNLRELNKSFFGSNSLYSLKNILDDQVLTYMWTIDTIYRRFLYFAWDNFKRKTFAYLPIQKLNLFSEIFILWPLFKIFKTISQIILIMYIIFMLNFFQKYNHTHTHVYWKLILMKHHYSEWELFLWITTRLDPVFYKGSLYK